MPETGDSATEMGNSNVLYNKDSAFYNFCAYGYTKWDPNMGRVYHTKDGAPGLMDSRSQWAADLYRGGEVLLGPTPIDNVQSRRNASGKDHAVTPPRLGVGLLYAGRQFTFLCCFKHARL